MGIVFSNIAVSYNIYKLYKPWYKVYLCWAKELFTKHGKIVPSSSWNIKIEGDMEYDFKCH